MAEEHPTFSSSTRWHSKQDATRAVVPSVMKAKMMAFKAMLLLLVFGVASCAASKCSSRNGGEDLTCQLRTLQSGLQASNP